jgi:quinol-cytochrome oxidoreductase complex cytochrome b subunit
VVLQFDLTGRLLTWEANSYWSTVRGLEVVFALPVVGPILAFLLGGRVVNADVLTRFYILHVLVLPVAYVVLLYLTFATLRRVGLSPVQPGETSPGTATLREHFYSMVILTLLLFAVLVTLATLLPFPFQSMADPYATPSGVRPPWYLLASYALMQKVPGPAWLSGLVLIALGIALLLLPLWPRGEPTPGRSVRMRLWGGAVLIVWIALSLAGAFLERT